MKNPQLQFTTYNFFKSIFGTLRWILYWPFNKKCKKMKNSDLTMKRMSNYDALKIWNKCNLESYTTITMYKIMTSALFEHNEKVNNQWNC